MKRCEQNRICLTDQSQNDVESFCKKQKHRDRVGGSVISRKRHEAEFDQFVYKILITYQNATKRKPIQSICSICLRWLFVCFSVEKLISIFNFHTLFNKFFSSKPNASDKWMDEHRHQTVWRRLLFAYIWNRHQQFDWIHSNSCASFFHYFQLISWVCFQRPKM